VSVRPQKLVRLSWRNCNIFGFRKVTEAETMSEVKIKELRHRLTARQYNSKLHLIARLCSIRNRCGRSVKCNYYLICWCIEWQKRKASEKILLISHFLHCLLILSMKCLNDIAPLLSLSHAHRKFFDRIPFAVGYLLPVNSVANWTCTFPSSVPYPPLHLHHFWGPHLSKLYWRLILIKQKCVLDWDILPVFPTFGKIFYRQDWN